MIYGFSNFGYDGSLVTVNADFSEGNSTDILGFADSLIAETKARVKSAIQNSGFDYPNKKVLVTLSPADLKKDSPVFDLPIALSILSNTSEKVLVMGELDSMGNLRPVRESFVACQKAIEKGIKYAILPEGSSAPDGIKICFVKKLKEAFIAFDNECFKNFNEIKLPFNSDIEFKNDNLLGDYSLDDYNTLVDNNLKFAMTVAVAGKHNLLVIGHPGCGKDAMIEKLPQILPQLSLEESQSTTRIHSLAGLVKTNENYITKRPFRQPHTSASIEGMCGGGINCRPGDVSLAHNGILFLDEASEFRSSCLQTLRVPMENHSITLSRAGRTTCYPSDFQLVMATSPCPCGNYGDKDKICLCSHKIKEMYWRKFPSPLLDRMEIRFDFNSNDVLTTDKMTVEKMQEMITTAWNMQKKRNEFNGRIAFTDSLKYDKEVFEKKFSNWFESEGLWKMAEGINSDSSLNWKRFQITLLARTIADMKGSEKISYIDFEIAKRLRADTYLDPAY